MSYVILSRITSLNQLYLTKFDPKKIYCSSVAKKEAARLRARAINLKETDWDRQRDGWLRISSLNARSLQQHQTDLKRDEFIMKSDIICIQETWLDSDPMEAVSQYHEYYVHGWSKGIAVFTKGTPILIERFQTDLCSIIKASYVDFDLLNIYRFSSEANLMKFTEQVHSLLDGSRAQIVVGDFNINLLKNPQNPFTCSLEQMGFRQLVTRPTHVLGGLIDHVYFYSPNMLVTCTLYKHHTVFWSDHTCQSLILKTTGCQ